MKIIYILVCSIVSTLVLPSVSNAQEDKTVTYYCTAEAEGGLFYNKAIKKWEGVRFEPRHKFVLRLKFVRTYVRKKVNEFDEDERMNVYEVTVTDAGEPMRIIHDKCTTNSDSNEVPVGKNNMVLCSTVFSDYKFNLDRNRYLETYAIGYADSSKDDEKSDTPTIEGGTCTKIE